jgi:beta-lactamase regulating signal transducer with metallopeptidase domain
MTLLAELLLSEMLLSELLLSDRWLLYGLNAAVASVVACTIAVLISRYSTWSLPARHAILMLAIAVCLLAPLTAPWIQLPSSWSIRVGEPPQLPPTLAPFEAQSAGEFHSPEAGRERVPASSTALAENPWEGLAAGEPAAMPPAPFVPAAIPPVAAEQPARWTLAEWAQLAGTLLCGVWLVGLTIGAIRSLIGLVRLRRWVRTIVLADSPALAAAVDAAAKSMGLSGKITLYRSNVLPAPVTCGLLRPRIVVPEGIESQLPADQLVAVLKHELAHLRRRDLWIGLMQQFAQIVYWWNPLVHLTNRQLADLREQICDEIAIRDLPQPGDYAATLLRIAEQCSRRAPVPATLGFGASAGRQLERRIRRIVSLPRAASVGLTRRAAAGVLAAAVVMSAAVLFAQVQVESPAAEPAVAQPAATLPSGSEPQAVPGKTPAVPPSPEASAEAATMEPTLSELIQHMAAYERMYLPFDIKAMETFGYPGDLTPGERARDLRADGRKHQKLMEYAQLQRRIWRREETSLVDGAIEQGPYEQFSDGARIIQKSPSPQIIDGVQTLEYYVNNRQNDIFNYLHATPLVGVFCLSSLGSGELFSEVFQANEEGVELTWDKGDAKLTFGYGKPDWNMKFALWLSREHDWHPVRLQRYLDANDEHFHDQWEVTSFVRRGKVWRVAEGMHRYRRRGSQMHFKILAEKYGSAVDEKQFQITIPAGAKIHQDEDAAAEPPPPAKTREIKFTVVDVAGNPIRDASVRLPANRLRDFDAVTTDENGVARSAKAPADNALVQIAAAAHRPATWIVGGDTGELRVILVPQSAGVVVDKGRPAAGAWITSAGLQFRVDGLPVFPQREWDGASKDWSDDAGRFELKTELTVRQPDGRIPLIAVDPDMVKMAIRVVPLRDLGQPQELALQPVCRVHGQSLLLGMTEDVPVSVDLESATGENLGFLATRRKLTPEGLRVDFEMRLPPGDYDLKSRPSAHAAGFSIPFQVSHGKSELDLGIKTVPPAKAIALRGQPAPGFGSTHSNTILSGSGRVFK